METNIITTPKPAPKIVGHEEPVTGTGTAVAVDFDVLVALVVLVDLDVLVAVLVDLDVDVADAAEVDVDVEVETADEVAVAVDVAVGVEATAQSVKLVVQAPPADGQQNCLALEAVEPQTSTRPF